MSACNEHVRVQLRLYSRNFRLLHVCQPKLRCPHLAAALGWLACCPAAAHQLVAAGGLTGVGPAVHLPVGDVLQLQARIGAVPCSCLHPWYTIAAGSRQLNQASRSGGAGSRGVALCLSGEAAAVASSWCCCCCCCCCGSPGIGSGCGGCRCAFHCTNVYQITLGTCCRVGSIFDRSGWSARRRCKQKATLVLPRPPLLLHQRCNHSLFVDIAEPSNHCMCTHLFTCICVEPTPAAQCPQGV